MSGEASGQMRKWKKLWTFYILEFVALFLLIGYLHDWQFIPLNYTRFIGSMETATQVKIDMVYQDPENGKYQKINLAISDPEEIGTLIGFFRDPQPITDFDITQVVQEEASRGTSGTITAETPQGVKMICFSNGNLVYAFDPASTFSKKGMFLLHDYSVRKLGDWLKSIMKLE